MWKLHLSQLETADWLEKFHFVVDIRCHHNKLNEEKEKRSSGCFGVQAQNHFAQSNQSHKTWAFAICNHSNVNCTWEKIQWNQKGERKRNINLSWWWTHHSEHIRIYRSKTGLEIEPADIADKDIFKFCFFFKWQMIWKIWPIRGCCVLFIGKLRWSEKDCIWLIFHEMWTQTWKLVVVVF